ncbi:MAG: DUF523 domain-containing protein [Oscillospiraceae bacterium]|nr:DUF523 domain-containing protein [Oscillospiraceae bacterium]
MKPAILMSACLMGTRCRYNAEIVESPHLAELMEKYTVIPVCPETLGGLPTPREPAERLGELVLTKSGADVTDYFERGADEVLRLARLYGCKCAVLKERSPSCGSERIYDGAFSGTLIGGDGVCAEVLKAAGIAVFGESRIDELLK